MSNELNLAYPGDASTIYAVLRRRSDSKVWNTANAAFETWADGTITDYDIALTAKSGDLYVADMPSAVTANTRLNVFYYLQDGATAAIADLVISIRDLFWTGQDATEGDTVSLASGALTSLASLKRYLRITSTTYDNLLTELINQMSDKIKRAIGHDLVATDYREWISGNSEGTMRLKHYPVISIDRLASGRADAITVQYSGTDIRATLSVYDAGVRLRSVAADGTVTTEAVDFATYPTASTVVTQINTVSDWAATLTTDVPSEDLNQLGGIDAKTAAINLTYPDDDEIAFDVDHTTGLIERRADISGYQYGSSGAYGDSLSYGASTMAPAGFVNVLAQYRAGYETLPDDVTLLANEMIATAFRRGARDMNLSNESIDNYSYGLAAATDLDERMMTVLAPYMEIR